MTKTNIDLFKLKGGKRKNGHKLDCTCHICENMKNKANRGGYTDEKIKNEEYKLGGTKKPNGHRKNCSCPICKNMNKSKKNKKLSKKGGLGLEDLTDTIENNEKTDLNETKANETDYENFEKNLNGGKKHRNTKYLHRFKKKNISRKLK